MVLLNMPHHIILADRVKLIDPVEIERFHGKASSATVDLVYGAEAALAEGSHFGEPVEGERKPRLGYVDFNILHVEHRLSGCSGEALGEKYDGVIIIDVEHGRYARRGLGGEGR